MDLEQKLVDMKKELREGRDEIIKTTDDYLSLKVCYLKGWPTVGKSKT